MDSKTFMRKYRRKMTALMSQLSADNGTDAQVRKVVARGRVALEMIVQEEVDRWIHSWEMANKAHNECLRSKGLLKDLV
jgi:hypothetical protein